ncbi:Uncharacterised protein [Streptococcus pneumoniae]|nr:Uncharacterised protein [Streptococcus pneumoniae]
MTIPCENINVKAPIYACNNGSDFKSSTISSLFIICVLDVSFLDTLFGKKNRDTIVPRAIKIEIVMKTHSTPAVAFIIPLKAGPTIAAVPTAAPDRAIAFPCFFAVVCFDKNVKAAGIKKPSLNPCIKRTTNSCSPL